jgi:hypothetical protein
VIGPAFYINVCAFQIGDFTFMAGRICHDALGFRASTFSRGSFLFTIAKVSGPTIHSQPAHSR